ncbi:MAG: DUF4328 domain-containing protein [Acidobacteriota bacterium]|nr:DUF4328 domain-containing protein [Acidobacteriota bacterium]MDH3528963.1 DUF4328 domain-containing protein [Acidobacteriota bacterium]
MKHEYSSTKTLAAVICSLLIAGIVIDGALLFLGIFEKLYFPGIWNAGPDDAMGDAEALFVIAYLLIAVLSATIFAVTIGFFLVWIKRSYRNLSFFGVQALNSTPGWAVGYWFIPILSFYYPLKIVNEIYHGSDPEIEPADIRVSDDSTPLMHGIWWALWVVGSIAGNISLRISLSSENASMIEIAEIADLALLPLWMACAWFAYSVVSEITRRQEIVGNAQAEFSPPAPPTFGDYQNESL